MVASSRAVLPLPGPPRMTTLPGGSVAASSAGGPSGSATGPGPGSALMTDPAAGAASEAAGAAGVAPGRPLGGWSGVGALGRFIMRAS